MKITNTFAAAISLAAVSLGLAGGATAMPRGPAAETEAPIVLVRGGCGLGFHRGPYGGCQPNGGRVFVEPRVIEPRVVAPVRLPPPCPRGYYRDPRPGVALCYPRF